MSLRPGIADHPARILIVDDERANRQLLEVMLAPEGLLLQTAASGEEALAMVAQQPPDLILLDIMMPGMDGYQVAGSIKGNVATRNIPIIMVTALEDREARIRGLQAGVEEFLTKPVDRMELCVRVRNLLRLKAYGDYYNEYSGMLEGAVASRSELLQIRTDQIRFKDEFLSHVSHELRSPLTAIKQFTSILLGGLAGELNTEQREYQEIVLRNVRQLQSMIDDLLEVTRLETGKLTIEPDRVSVANAVTDTFNTLQGTARAKGVTLLADLPADLPPAYADPTRLRQILIILFENGIKFTPSDGTVTIRVGVLQQDPPFLLLEVSDTGCGINPAIAERVFDRLYQASASQNSRQGLGLGLYICKELVTRQGGRIWVDRQREKGSTLSFTLPISCPTTVPTTVPTTAAALPRTDAWDPPVQSQSISEAIYHG